jgi:nucleoside permease NupC
LQLALNIGGMLIAFLALIAMVNGLLGWLNGVPDSVGCQGRCRAFSVCCLRRLRG